MAKLLFEQIMTTLKLDDRKWKKKNFVSVFQKKTFSYKEAGSISCHHPSNTEAQQQDGLFTFAVAGLGEIWIDRFALSSPPAMRDWSNPSLA